MNTVIESLDNALENYHRDLTLFIVDNEELLEVLEVVLKRGHAYFHEMEYIRDLYDNFNSYIEFHSEYNENINTYIL